MPVRSTVLPCSSLFRRLLFLLANNHEESEFMTEEEYYAGNISDGDIDVLADAGDFMLEKSGFNSTPAQREISQWSNEYLRETGEQYRDEFNNPYDQENPYFC